MGVSNDFGVGVLVVTPDLLVRNENESIDRAIVGGVLAEVADQFIGSVRDELVHNNPLGAFRVLRHALLVKLRQVPRKAQYSCFRKVFVEL